MCATSHDRDTTPPANATPDAHPAAAPTEDSEQPSQSATMAPPPITDRDDDEAKEGPRAAGSEIPRPESPAYDANDARTMSPRRNSAEIEQMAADTRAALLKEARLAQDGLMEIAESIELVRSDHDKLEKQNLALQDYIGGLTRSMAKGDVSGKGKK